MNRHQIGRMEVFGVREEGGEGSTVVGVGQRSPRCREGWGSASGKYFLCFSEKEPAAQSRFQALKESFTRGPEDVLHPPGTPRPRQGAAAVLRASVCDRAGQFSAQPGAKGRQSPKSS